MKTLFLMVGALSLVAIAGCRGPRSGIPEGAKVAVLEFRIPETANITRYSASYNDLGMIVAQQIAEVLRERHPRQGIEFVSQLSRQFLHSLRLASTSDCRLLCELASMQVR